MQAEGSFEKMVVYLKRLLAEREEALPFLPPFGLMEGLYLGHGPRPQARGAAAPVAVATVPSRGDHADGSTWGTWQ
jgi:hypothetical protein